MTSLDWLWLLHPVLAVVLVYPLLGQVLRLAQQARQRRLGSSRVPPAAGAEHADLGRWLTGAVVAAELVALAVVLATAPSAQPRLPLLALVWLGTALALAALWRARQPLYRTAFVGLTLAGLLGLGLQPEVWRLSDQPWTAAFWQSHFWGGLGLTGLLLASLAAKPEIQRSLRWRRLHLSANGLAALIFLAQAITGSRDLLEIPLSWQKPVIFSCNFEARTCPPPAPAPSP
jgi:hypothetical protein